MNKHLMPAESSGDGDGIGSNNLSKDVIHKKVRLPRAFVRCSRQVLSKPTNFVTMLSVAIACFACDFRGSNLFVLGVDDVPLPVLIENVNSTPLPPLVEILADKIDGGQNATFAKRRDEIETDPEDGADSAAPTPTAEATKPEVDGLLQRISRIFSENVGQFMNPGNRTVDFSPVPGSNITDSDEKSTKKEGVGHTAGISVEKVPTVKGSRNKTMNKKKFRKKLLKNSLKDKIKPPQKLKPLQQTSGEFLLRFY